MSQENLVEEQTEIATEVAEANASSGSVLFFGMVGDELDLLAEKHDRAALNAGAAAVLRTIDTLEGSVQFTVDVGDEEEGEEVEITLAGGLEKMFEEINS